jgi:hypothetical protein
VEGERTIRFVSCTRWTCVCVCSRLSSSAVLVINLIERVRTCGLCYVINWSRPGRGQRARAQANQIDAGTCGGATRGSRWQLGSRAKFAAQPLQQPYRRAEQAEGRCRCRVGGSRAALLAGVRAWSTRWSARLVYSLECAPGLIAGMRLVHSSVRRRLA